MTSHPRPYDSVTALITAWACMWTATAPAPRLLDVRWMVGTGAW